MDLIATPQSLSAVPGGTEVKVTVVGPKFAPDEIRSLRARGRALVSAGMVETTVDTIDSLTMGQIKRLTREEGSPSKKKKPNMMVETTHTIIVGRD